MFISFTCKKSVFKLQNNQIDLISYINTINLIAIRRDWSIIDLNFVLTL